MEVIEWGLVAVAVVGGGILAAVVLWDLSCEIWRNNK